MWAVSVELQVTDVEVLGEKQQGNTTSCGGTLCSCCEVCHAASLNQTLQTAWAWACHDRM